MGNMSYCRYRNTLGDLRDCFNALQEEAEEGSGELHYEEKHARAELVALCKEIAENGDDWIDEADGTAELQAKALEVTHKDDGSECDFDEHGNCIECGANCEHEGNCASHADGSRTCSRCGLGISATEIA